MSKVSFEKKSFRFILKASCTACLFALSMPIWAADGCKATVEIAPDVIDARQRISSALLASFRHEVPGFALLGTTVYGAVAQKVCPSYKTGTTGHGLLASASYFVIENGKKEIEQARICNKELQDIQDTPYPADVQAKLTEIEEEIMDMPAKRRGMRTGTPEHQELFRREEALLKLRRDITKPHLDELQLKTNAANNRCVPIWRAVKSGTKIDITLLANVKSYNNGGDLMFLGKSGEDSYFTKQAFSVLVTGRGDGQYSKALEDQIKTYLPRLVDLSKLQALVGGNIPSQDSSQTQIALLKAALPEGKKISQAHSDESSQIHQIKNKRDALSKIPRRATAAAAPAPSPASNVSPVPNASQATPAPVSAPAPSPAPAPANPVNVPNLPNLGNAAEGLNKLKGLFGR